MQEYVLGVGQLAKAKLGESVARFSAPQLPGVVTTPIDVDQTFQWNWTKTNTKDIVPEYLFQSNLLDEAEFRKHILYIASFNKATLVIWRMEPNSVYPYAGMCTIAIAGFVKDEAITAVKIPGLEGTYLPPDVGVIEPKNNDGRDFCFWCGIRTEKKQLFNSFYNICPKCRK